MIFPSMVAEPQPGGGAPLRAIRALLRPAPRRNIRPPSVAGPRRASARAARWALASALAWALACTLAGATVARGQSATSAYRGAPDPTAGGGELIAAADELRRGRCGPASRGAPALRRRDALDRAARAFADGLPLGQALQRAGYVATESAGLRIEGARDPAALRRVLEERFCSRLASEALGEVGAWRSGARAWLVIATAPMPAPTNGGARAGLVSGSAAPDPSRGAEEVLALVNAARAQPRRCGSQSFAGSPALAPSAPLERVARAHADDMAWRSYFDHTGADGSSPPQRVTRGGYAWKIAGENLALGRMTAREAVDGWLASPGHCANIMDPRFTETGVALATGRERDRPTYWVQTFAAPQLR